MTRLTGKDKILTLAVFVLIILIILIAQGWK